MGEWKMFLRTKLIRECLRSTTSSGVQPQPVASICLNSTARLNLAARLPAARLSLSLSLRLRIFLAQRPPPVYANRCGLKNRLLAAGFYRANMPFYTAYKNF